MTNSKNLIRVFEYEKLGIRPNSREGSITESQLKRLYEFNDKNENKYFEGVRDGVKFKSFVGVIRIGRLTIEILPKADRRSLNTDEDCSQWQAALLKMLSYCNLLDVSSVSQAKLTKRHNNLLDLYFQMYLNEVNQLIHQGLIKQYRRNQGNLTKLKGRLLFSEQIKKNLIHQERMYTDHQVYDQNNLYNKILLKGLLILSRVVSDSYLSDQINRILFNFPEVDEVNITATDFEKIVISRKTKPYQKALNIAKMIILNYAPAIRTGQEEMIALLFDMNKLWEEYVYRMLLRAGKPAVQIKYNQSKKFWNKKTIRPDIEVIKEDQQGLKRSYIIDTKWKIIDRKNPADNDLKQMFAYNLLWQSEKSMLLYPSNEEVEDDEFGNFHHTPIYKNEDDYLHLEENKCKLGFVNVLDENGELDLDIGWRILDKLK